MSGNIKTIAFVVLVSSLIAGQFVYAQGVEKPSQLFVPIVDLEIIGLNKISADSVTVLTINFTVSEYPITDAVLDFTLPEMVLFDFASGTGQISQDNIITWHYESLAPGNYTETVSISPVSPIANATELEFDSSLYSRETVAITDTFVMTVLSVPLLKVIKTITPTSLSAGEQAVISVEISNQGTDSAENVTVTEITSNQIEITNSEKTRKIGQIPANTSQTIDFQIRLISNSSSETISTETVITADNHEKLLALADVKIIPEIVLVPEVQELENILKPDEIATPVTEQIEPSSTGQVLGASTSADGLTETGIGFRDWLTVFVATFLITAGITTLLFYPFSKNGT
ncbi:MAG: CARDB domain-containing protein [bacterium]